MLDCVVVVGQVHYCALFRMEYYCSAHCILRPFRVVSGKSSLVFIFIVMNVNIAQFT